MQHAEQNQKVTCKFSSQVQTG